MDLRALYNSTKFAGGFTGRETFYKAVKKKFPGVKRSEINNYLKKDDAYTLHRPIQKSKKWRRVYAKHINYLYQIDLSDLSSMVEHNDGQKWILNIIDCFSKKCWAIAMKDKRGITITNAIKPILTRNKPCKIETDGGTEFKNRHFRALLRRLKIQTYSIYSDRKCALVERLQRTLKSRLYRAMTARGVYRWVDILQDIVDAYNNSPHRSHGLAPIMVTPRNSAEVRKKLYPPEKPAAPPKLKLGDTVRISRKKSAFQKSYHHTFSYEIFEISEVKKTNPVTYGIKDFNQESIKGSFYSVELQEVDRKDNIYPIEKIVAKRKRRGKLYYLVKYLGYPDSLNTWVPQEDLFKL